MLQSLTVYVTETLFVCLQTSSRPGPALEDDKVVGAVSSPFQAFGKLGRTASEKKKKARGFGL